MKIFKLLLSVLDYIINWNAKLKEYCFRKKFGKIFGGGRERKFTFVLDYYKNPIQVTFNMGSCNAFILTYLSPLFDRFIGKYPNVILDKDFDSGDHHQTFILLGSPFINDAAARLLENNKYVRFKGIQDQAKSIEIIVPGYNKGPLQVEKGHYGIVLKLNNKYSDENFLFFLAGLTNESTSAAGLLLLENWDKIRKSVGRQQFLILFEVDKPGNDTTYKVLFTDPDMPL